MAAELLHVDLDLTPADDRTTRIFAFEVPAPTQALEVILSYTPPIFEDAAQASLLAREALDHFGYPSNEASVQAALPLQNFITVSLDDPQGYRGNAHRKTNPQHIRLTNDAATAGFYVRPLLGGPWRLMLHLHAIVSAQVRCHCAVRAVLP